MSHGGTGESWAGRVLVFLTVLVVFVAPIWVMLTAGLMQVFPDAMGMDLLMDDAGNTRHVVTLRSLFLAGTVAVVPLAGFGLAMSLFGGTSWVLSKVQGVLDRSAEQRFRHLAGDVVMDGVELKTTTRQAEEGE